MVYRANLSGTVLGAYRIHERIGQGGVADVYRASQVSLNREVALKVIPLLDSAEYDYLQEQFKQEADVITRLEHPHILPVFDHGILGDIFFIAMRYVRGGSLRDWLLGSPLPVPRVIALMTDVADALGYAHRRGIVHRDLKPSNILLDEDENAYLGDFGLAAVLGGSSQITATGAVIGTPAYMAPEQLRGDPVDHRADLYSFGVILFQMLTGRLPFEAMSTFSLIYQHVEKPAPRVREVNPDVLPALEFVVARLLSKDPSARYSSAAEMAAALQGVGREEAAVAETLDDVNSAHTVVVHPVGEPVEEGDPAAKSKVSAERSSRPGVTGSLVLRYGGLVTILLLLVLSGSALFGAFGKQPRSRPVPVILEGVEGTPDDIVPGNDELALARQMLGEDGFIAYVTCNQTSEFFVVLARGLFELAARYDLNLVMYDSRTDAYESVVAIERARRDGASALIVCVVDESVVSDTLAAAVQAGVPLVLHNLESPPSFGGVIMTLDEYMLGYIPGRYAGGLAADELNGQANVVVLDFPSLPSVVKRANGLWEGLLEEAPGARLVAREIGGTIDLAQRSIRRLLEQGAEIDVILSINDSGAYGAIETLKEAGIGPDEVIIVSVDAETIARQYVREGYYMRATQAVLTEEMPDVLLNAIVKQLAGSEIPQTIELPLGELYVGE